VRQPQPPQLALHDRDVRLGGDARVLPRLHGVLLGGQPEGVEAQGVQHVVALHPAEAADDVRGDVPERVADVQPGPGRVGEHVHHEERAPTGLGVAARTVGEVTGGVRREEGPPAVPLVLPARLDRRGERRGVAVGHLVGGRGRPGGADLLRRHLGEFTGGGPGPRTATAPLVGVRPSFLDFDDVVADG
jgi:hypothetical protein